VCEAKLANRQTVYLYCERVLRNIPLPKQPLITQHMESPGNFGRFRRSLCVWLCVAVYVAGCESRGLELLQPEIDMSPVGCNYKWFQTGYSPQLPVDCAQERSADFGLTQIDLASRAAWDVAEHRCPASCPPRELKDTSVWTEPYPDGVCRQNLVYYTKRVFFGCSIAQ